jgi:toxin ParE1/3/4
MKPPARFDDEAEEELQAAAAWYERERPGFGLALLDGVADAVYRLRETPTAFPLSPDVPRELCVRRVLVRRFPYAVVFMELEHEIRILAVARERRRPGYWRDRLEP